MSLTKEECLNALETLCTYADCYPSSSGEFVGKMLQEADDTLQELIEEHFELVDLLKRHDLENLSIEELDKWFERSLYHVNKVNLLSNKLVELGLVVNSKQKMIDELKKTINENIYKIFNNPPLKFEELKENMWVWDNLYKDYVKLKRHDIENFGKLIIFSKGFDEEHLRKFEENRFYRREV